MNLTPHFLTQSLKLSQLECLRHFSSDQSKYKKSGEGKDNRPPVTPSISGKEEKVDGGWTDPQSALYLHGKIRDKNTRETQEQKIDTLRGAIQEHVDLLKEENGRNQEAIKAITSIIAGEISKDFTLKPFPPDSAEDVGKRGKLPAAGDAYNNPEYKEHDYLSEKQKDEIEKLRQAVQEHVDLSEQPDSRTNEAVKSAKKLIGTLKQKDEAE